jgi:hypothetical protein
MYTQRPEHGLDQQNGIPGSPDTATLNSLSFPLSAEPWSFADLSIPARLPTSLDSGFYDSADEMILAENMSDVFRACPRNRIFVAVQAANEIADDTGFSLDFDILPYQLEQGYGSWSNLALAAANHDHLLRMLVAAVSMAFSHTSLLYNCSARMNKHADYKVMLEATEVFYKALADYLQMPEFLPITCTLTNSGLVFGKVSKHDSDLFFKFLNVSKHEV